MIPIGHRVMFCGGKYWLRHGVVESQLHGMAHPFVIVRLYGRHGNLLARLHDAINTNRLIDFGVQCEHVGLGRKPRAKREQ